MKQVGIDEKTLKLIQSVVLQSVTGIQTDSTQLFHQGSRPISSVGYTLLDESCLNQMDNFKSRNEDLTLQCTTKEASHSNDYLLNYLEQSHDSSPMLNHESSGKFAQNKTPSSLATYLLSDGANSTLTMKNIKQDTQKF